MPWVIETQVGYANGAFSEITTTSYEEAPEQGFAEAVRVTYNPEAVSLTTLAERFFEIINPLSIDRQGGDIGHQYRAGVYYLPARSEIDLPALQELFQLEAKRFGEELKVELLPLENFATAEEYHQNYLEKNTDGYCHIPFTKLDQKWPLIDKRLYPKPSNEELKERLNALQYAVTQRAATEKPFTGALNQEFEKGIYVEIATGEPLFKSQDKFDSGCGWPSFSQPIDKQVITEAADSSIPGRPRTEVRSLSGDSHLGHVFKDGNEHGSKDPDGLRYCINSASLRFVPYEQLAAEGYGYLEELF